MDIGICDFCNAPTPSEELHRVGSHLLCEGCEEDALICERCGEPLLADDNGGTNSFPLCRNCYNEAYTSCNQCDELLRLDQAYYTEDDDDRPLCYDCYCNSAREEKWIEQYSFKPDPIFYGEGPRFMGLEVELDIGGFSHSNAKRLLDIANRNNELLYIKSDSSLENGFELVSHPCSLDFHMSAFPWKELFGEAIRMGYRGHSCSTAGIHIHLSCLALGSTTTTQEIVIGRIIFFFSKHWDEILIFSRRTQTQIDRWSRKYNFKDSPRDTLEDAKESSNGRYNCINILNPDTVEFRVFRSSLRLNTLLAALQFVDAICDAAISLTDDEMQNLSWQQFVKDLDPSRRKELIEYLKIRQLYVNDAVQVEEDL
jgi:hypothetical protein